MGPNAYKISFTVPKEFKDAIMDEINASMEQIYPGYDRVFSVAAVEGTWRSLEGSNPYIGSVGEVSVEEELRIDFAVKEKDLKNVISAIVRIHPYEEPAIDVIPMMLWKDIIDP